MKFRWPLVESNFTLWDRLKIAWFLLSPNNRWTMGDRVKEYERQWAAFAGTKYACMVASGSAANTLIAQFFRDRIDADGRGSRNAVILPAVTWQTSVSPWIRAGFRPLFVDIDPKNLCLSEIALRSCLELHGESVAAVFPTALLGFTPRIDIFLKLCHEFDVPLILDNCENIFGTLGGRHICSFATSSTSLYFGHQATTGTEGGVLFTNSTEEFEYFLMARNHGMIRSLTPYSDWIGGRTANDVANPLVHPAFDFAILGSNFRSSDLAAFMGLLDMRRLTWNRERRSALFDYFVKNKPPQLFAPEQDGSVLHVPFALPLIFPLGSDGIRNQALKECAAAGIETRPIVGGNLLRQRCFRSFGCYTEFPNAEHVHNCGFYVGLHPRLTFDMIDEVIDRVTSLL